MAWSGVEPLLRDFQSPALPLDDRAEECQVWNFFSQEPRLTKKTRLNIVEKISRYSCRLYPVRNGNQHNKSQEKADKIKPIGVRSWI